MNLLMSDEDLSLRGDILRDAIAADKQRGLIPFFVRLPHAVNQCDLSRSLVSASTFVVPKSYAVAEKNCTVANL